jgi:ABC-type transport system involved in cytochrome bd biosynthesis fused ATPase/permease subunit
MNTIDLHRTREARVITTAVAAVCALGCAAAVVPGAEQRITTALAIGAGVLALLLVVRTVARRVREHIEDRADERVAAVLRAEYQARRAQQGAEDIVRGRA